MAAVLYTILFMMGGLAIIRTQLPGKSPLMRAFLGLALGILLEMELPALCANLFDFSLKAHYVAAVTLLAITGVSFLLRDPSPAKGMSEADRRLLATIALVVLPLTVLSAYLQHTHMLMPAESPLTKLLPPSLHKTESRRRWWVLLLGASCTLATL